MKIGLRLLCDSHILYNTGDNIFLSFRILLTLALIPCVAVNLCPGELIRETSKPNLSVATSDEPLTGINEDHTLEID